MNAPSRRSTLLAGLGLGLVLALWALLGTLDPDSYAFLALSDLGEAAVIAAAAAVLFLTVFSMDPGRFRTRWIVIGCGAASFAIGDFVWSYYELVLQTEVPYPGLPDLFYVGEYLLLSGALVAAGVAYKGIVDIKRPALIATLGTAAAAVFMWFAFIAPLAVDTESSLAERVFNVFYPMADVVLLGGPALFTILVVARLGAGKLARPWWAVAAGVLILAASDTAFSWMSAADAYVPGTIVDIGWMLAHVAIAFGALIALDLVGPVRVAAGPAPQSA